MALTYFLNGEEFSIPFDVLSLNKDSFPHFSFDFYFVYGGGNEPFHCVCDFDLVQDLNPTSDMYFSDSLNTYTYFLSHDFTWQDFDNFKQTFDFICKNYNQCYLTDSSGAHLVSSPEEEIPQYSINDVYELLFSWNDYFLPLEEEASPDPNGLPSVPEEAEPQLTLDNSEIVDTLTITNDLLLSISESNNQLVDSSTTSFSEYVLLDKVLPDLNTYSLELVILLAAFLCFYVFRGLKNAIIRAEGGYH